LRKTDKERLFSHGSILSRAQKGPVWSDEGVLSIVDGPAIKAASEQASKVAFT
jgi:hypothetical protein